MFLAKLVPQVAQGSRRKGFRFSAINRRMDQPKPEIVLKRFLKRACCLTHARDLLNGIFRIGRMKGNRQVQRIPPGEFHLCALEHVQMGTQIHIAGFSNDRLHPGNIRRGIRNENKLRRRRRNPVPQFHVKLDRYLPQGLSALPVKIGILQHQQRVLIGHQTKTIQKQGHIRHTLNVPARRCYVFHFHGFLNFLSQRARRTQRFCFVSNLATRILS